LPGDRIQIVRLPVQVRPAAGEAAAAAVERDEPEMAREPRELGPEHPMIHRPAVQQHQRRTAADDPHVEPRIGAAEPGRQAAGRLVEHQGR